MSSSANAAAPAPRRSGAPLWGHLVNGLILTIAAIGLVTLQRATIREASEVPDNPEMLQEREGIRLELLLNLPAFGFENWIADWAFLSYLQYFGDTPVREVTGYDLNVPYFDLITQRDPRFLEIYPFLSAGVSYYAADPQTAIAFMKRGTDVLDPEIQPQAFWVWWYRALDSLLLLGDVPAAIEGWTRAADWAERSGVPEYARYAESFRGTARALQQNPDSKPARFYAWNSVYLQAVDEPIKKRAERELLLLGAERVEGPDGRTQFRLPQSER